MIGEGDMGRESTRIALNEILDRTAPKEIDGKPLDWSIDFTSQEVAVTLSLDGKKHYVPRIRDRADEAIKACVSECLEWAKSQ
jgi:hypothetical protein